MHYFRAFAIFSVISVHMWIVPPLEGHESMSRFLDMLRGVLFHSSTLYFVFISGYLFHFLAQRKFDLRTYYRKKLLNVIVPYVILSVFFTGYAFFWYSYTGEALESYHGLDAGQVFVGVGSDDVLALAFLTFFNSDKPILFPDITYSFYDVWADMLRIPYETKPLDADFRIKASDYYGENGGVVFPNPNAPTGIAEPVEFVRDIVSHNPDVIVIVDEAYVDFGGQTALPLLKEFDNLLVVRTFSKSRSMAGLRIGYALGNEKLIGYLNDVKYSYNSYTMDLTSIELGTCSIKADDYFKEMVKKVVDTRTWFVKEIEALGFTVLPSSANFVFATHKTIPAKEIFVEKFILK